MTVRGKDMAKKKKRVVLNLQEIRAERDEIVITDPDGREFNLGGLSVDTYLKILQFENEFDTMDEDKGVNQVELLDRTKAFINTILPEFNVDKLYLEEIFMVFAAIQESITEAMGPSTSEESENNEESEGN